MITKPRPQRLEKLLPTDVIIGTLAYFSEAHPGDTLDADEIYTQFNELAEQHPELFGGFYFYKCGNGHNSKELEDIFMGLGAWGMTTTDAPRYRTLRVAPKSAAAIRVFLGERYAPETLAPLQKLAEELYVLR